MWSPFWLLAFNVGVECIKTRAHGELLGVFHMCVQKVGGIPFPDRSPMAFSMSPRAMNHHNSAYVFTWAPLKAFSSG